MTLQVGSDPEVIIINKEGYPVSSENLIGGDKLNPRETPHGFVQEDNVLLEFNPEPATSRDMFVTNTNNMLEDIKTILQPLDLSISIQSSGHFLPHELETRQAREAGCEPDFDAWTRGTNIPPDLNSTALRSCGGHLHIAFDKANDMEASRSNLAQVLDLVAAVPSIVMDSDTDRRSLYGKAGAYRPKYIDQGDAYDGIEYRTLSNFWIASTARMRWAYDAVVRAVMETDELLDIVQTEQSRVLSSINDADIAAAEYLISRYNLGVAT